MWNPSATTPWIRHLGWGYPIKDGFGMGGGRINVLLWDDPDFAASLVFSRAHWNEHEGMDPDFGMGHDLRGHICSKYARDEQGAAKIGMPRSPRLVLFTKLLAEFYE